MKHHSHNNEPAIQAAAEQANRATTQHSSNCCVSYLLLSFLAINWYLHQPTNQPTNSTTTNSTNQPQPTQPINHNQLNPPTNQAPTAPVRVSMSITVRSDMRTSPAPGGGPGSVPRRAYGWKRGWRQFRSRLRFFFGGSLFGDDLFDIVRHW